MVSAASTSANPIYVASANNATTGIVHAHESENIDKQSFVTPEIFSEITQVPYQLNLSNLQRITDDDEERKRRLLGGGGGSSAKDIFKSPTLFVLFSIKLINEGLEQLKALLDSALQSGNQSSPQASIVNDVQNYVESSYGAILNAVKTPLVNFSNALSDAANTALQFASSLGSNFANLATVAMSILANKLYKLISGEDLEKITNDNGEEVNEEFSIFDNLKQLLFDKKNNESNERSIVSHLKNMADQTTRTITKLVQNLR